MDLHQLEKWKQNPNEQFDTYFQNEAKKQNKAVGGLETLDYQMKVLFSAPMPRQIEQLMCLVDNYDYQTELLKRTIKAFYAEDMNAIQQIYEEKLHNTCDMTPAEENALIYTRNANWAKALPNIMSQRSTLVAVGAAHLPGPRGLLQLLKDAVWPSNSTSPLSGAVMRLIMRIRVVLPAPLGPNSPNTLPRGTLMLTSLRAVWAA